MSKEVSQFSYSLKLSFNKDSSCTNTPKSNLHYMKINNDHTIQTNSACPSDLVSTAIPRALQQVLTHYEVGANKLNLADLSLVQDILPNTRREESFAANDLTFSKFQRIKEDSIFNSTALPNISARQEDKLLSEIDSRLLTHGRTVIESIEDKVRTKGKKRKRNQCNAVQEESREYKQLTKCSNHQVYVHHDDGPQNVEEYKFSDVVMNTVENNCDKIVKSDVNSIGSDDGSYQSINLKSKYRELCSEHFNKNREIIEDPEESLNENLNNRDGKNIGIHLEIEYMNENEKKNVKQSKYSLDFDETNNDHSKENKGIEKLIHPVSKYVNEIKNKEKIMQANIINFGAINESNLDIKDELDKKQIVVASICDEIEQSVNKEENGQKIEGRKKNEHVLHLASDYLERKGKMESHNKNHMQDLNGKKNVNCDINKETMNKKSPEVKCINQKKMKKVDEQNIEEESNENLKLDEEVIIEVHSEFRDEQNREGGKNQKNVEHLEINNDDFKEEQKNLYSIHTAYSKNFNLVDKMKSDIQSSSGYGNEILTKPGQAKQKNEIIEVEMNGELSNLGQKENKNNISPVSKNGIDKQEKPNIIINKDPIRNTRNLIDDEKNEGPTEGSIAAKTDEDSTLVSPFIEHVNLKVRKSKKIENYKQILKIDDYGIMYPFDQVEDEKEVCLGRGLESEWYYENGNNLKKSMPKEIHEKININAEQDKDRNKDINLTQQEADKYKNEGMSKEPEKKPILEMEAHNVNIHHESQIQDKKIALHQNILATIDDEGMIFKKKKETGETIQKEVKNEHSNLDTKEEKSHKLNCSSTANKYKKGRKYKNILIQSILMEKMIDIMQSPRSGKCDLNRKCNRDFTSSAKITHITDSDNMNKNEKFLRKRRKYKKLFNVDDEYEPDTSIHGCTSDSKDIMQDHKFNNNPRLLDADRGKKCTRIKNEKEKGTGNISAKSKIILNGVKKHSNNAKQEIEEKKGRNELDLDKKRKIACNNSERSKSKEQMKNLEEEPKIFNKGNQIQSNRIKIKQTSERESMVLMEQNLHNYYGNKSTYNEFNSEENGNTVPERRVIGKDKQEGKKLISNKIKLNANEKHDNQIISTLGNENVNMKRSESKIQLDERVTNILSAKFKSFFSALENNEKTDSENTNVTLSRSEHSRNNGLSNLGSAEKNKHKNISVNVKKKSIQQYVDCREIQDSEEDYNHWETDSEEDPELEYKKMQSYTVSPDKSTSKDSVKHSKKVNKSVESNLVYNSKPNNIVDNDIVLDDDDMNIQSPEDNIESEYKELQYSVSPQKKISKDTSLQFDDENKGVKSNSSNRILSPKSNIFCKYDRGTNIASDDDMDIESCEGELKINSPGGSVLLQSHSASGQNNKSKITLDDDDMDLESIGEDTEFEYKQMQSYIKSPQRCVSHEFHQKRTSADYDRQLRCSNKDEKSNSSCGILLLHSHSITKKKDETNIPCVEDMDIELPAEDPEYIDMQTYVESKECISNVTVGNLTQHSNSIRKQINATNMASDNDEMEIESLGEYSAIEYRKTQSVLPLQKNKENSKTSQSIVSDDFSEKLGNGNIILSSSESNKSCIDYNDVPSHCNVSKKRNNTGDYLCDNDSKEFVRNIPELTCKERKPYVVSPQNGTFRGDEQLENQEKCHQFSSQQSRLDIEKMSALPSPNSADATSVLFFSERRISPSGMSPQTKIKKNSLLHEGSILSYDINRPNEYNEIIADIEEITKNSAENILNSNESPQYFNNELIEIQTCTERFIPNNFKPRTEINLSDSEPHSESENDESIDKNEKAQSYINSFIQQSRLIMDMTSELDDTAITDTEKGPVQLQTGTPGIQRVNSITERHTKEKTSRKVPKNEVHREQSKKPKRKSINKNQSKCSGKIQRKRIKTPKNKSEKVQKKKHNGKNLPKAKSILEFFKKENDSSVVFERDSSSRNQITSIDSNKMNNTMDETNSPEVMINGEICNAELNEELGVSENLNFEPDSKNDVENSYTFADILSQSNATRLEKEFEDIFDDASRDGAHSDWNPEDDDSSSTNSSDINDTTQKRRKSKVHCGKINKPSSQQLKAKEEKKKLIELIRQSKSIWEIHEELNIQKKDQLEEKIHNLIIRNPYPLSRIHVIASNIIKTPSEEQRKILKKEGIHYKLGHFSNQEDDRLRNNWKEFCKLHSWDETDYLPFVNGSERSKYGVLSTKQILKFIQFLSHGFEKRTMRSVYHRFRKIFSSKEHQSGRFTEEDDEIILEYIKTSKSTEPYTDLATILKRSQPSIMRRHKLLQMRTELQPTKIHWNKDLGEKLLVNLIEATCSINLSELKNHAISVQEWSQVAKKMKLPVENIKRSWFINFYPRFFIPNYFENIERINKKLVDVVSSKYSNWKEIDWSTVANELGVDFPAIKCSKTLRDLVRNKVPSDLQSDLKRALIFLKNEDLSSSEDRFSFVMDILKETNNGTKLPRIN